MILLRIFLSQVLCAGTGKSNLEAFHHYDDGARVEFQTCRVRRAFCVIRVEGLAMVWSFLYHRALIYVHGFYALHGIDIPQCHLWACSSATKVGGV